jgi:DMSO/TMAO reductase YedYZ molybdopterin-dependent catalytic subunit
LDATLLWRGVLLRDLLNETGISPGAKTVIVQAHDGYTTSFMGEYFTVGDILMAYRLNNVTAAAKRGFPSNWLPGIKGYKWIKGVERLELAPDANYHGTEDKEAIPIPEISRSSFSGNILIPRGPDSGNLPAVSM